MGGGTLSNELLDIFDYSADTASSSAFIQQRNKIRPEAFETIFKSFSKDISFGINDDELKILAVDGSGIQIATNPDDNCFDVNFQLKLTRTQTKETKKLLKDKNHYKFIASNSTFDYLPVKNKKAEPLKFYELNFRMVRFQITDDTYETVLTNTDAGEYPSEELKKLYATRWGIETSFRDLQYTIGLLNFHLKKDDVYPARNLCTPNNV